ncbi:MAG: hypothetical protein L0Z50_12045 [Verrucomicrobiales bacterium]|nr:hypothetical protein [Verrucomicrobiales bacterium]
MHRLFLILLLAVLARAEQLRIRVTGESNQPIWTRLEVRGPDGRLHHPPDSIFDQRANNRTISSPAIGAFVVEGECKLDLPAGRYTVIAEHGLEYDRVERAVDVPASVEIQLKPWVQMSKLGWWSGDMHVHRPVEHAAALAQADDLNVSIVFTMWNRRNLWADRPLPADPVVRVTGRHFYTLMNAEDERGGGAWMLHGLPRPLELAVPGRWFPAGIQFVQQARAMRESGKLFPWFDLEKLLWWEVPVIMALAPADSLGVLHNHFDQYGMLANEAWGRPRDTAKFPGQEGFAAYTTGLYYRYLNLGFKLPPSAGSASGVLPNPVGYNRMYVKLDGPLSVEKWYATVRDGESFVTNGPMLFCTARPQGKDVRVSVKTSAREPIDRIEIVANGEIVAQAAAPANALRFDKDFTVAAGNHSWIAARAFLKTPFTVRMAHSRPVFLSGKWDASADKRYFTDWIDQLIARTKSDTKRFANETERNAIVELYQRARRFYAVSGDQ